MADQIPDNDVHNHPAPTGNISDNDIHNLPAFEQDVAKNVKLVSGDEPGTIAHTDLGDGGTISIDKPGQFDNTILAHEMTHIIQNRSGANNYVTPTSKAYNYGGTKGLSKVNSISTLNDEQQANIPKNYMDSMHQLQGSSDSSEDDQDRAGVLKQGDKLNSAYTKPMQQLENMANPSKDTINTTPQPPGPPPAELTGMIKPLPQMGGKTIYVTGKDPHSKALNKARKALGGG